MIAWFVLAAALFAFYYLVLRSDEGHQEELEPILFQQFTPKSLAQYNGTLDPRVLLAVNGKVYDVSGAKSYYGPGGMYENFAGRDASRGLAKHSFEAEHLTPLDAPIDELLDLSPEERQQLAQWAEFFAGKYPHCGDLVEPAEAKLPAR